MFVGCVACNPQQSPEETPAPETLSSTGYPIKRIAVTQSFDFRIGNNPATVKVTEHRTSASEHADSIFFTLLQEPNMRKQTIGVLPNPTLIDVSNWLSSHLDSTDFPRKAFVSNVSLRNAKANTLQFEGDFFFPIVNVTLPGEFSFLFGAAKRGDLYGFILQDSARNVLKGLLSKPRP